MIIGIAGVSRAGKTTLATLLSEYFEAKGKSTIVLSQDDFVKPESKLPRIKDKIDWEDPESIDFKKYTSRLKKLKKKYDLVFAEGLFAFYDEGLNKLYDKQIFIKIPKSLFVKRKEIDLRWGSKPEPKWYIEHIWKSYRKYGSMNIADECLVVSGEERFKLSEIADSLSVYSIEEIRFEEIADKLSSQFSNVERGPMMSAKGIRYKNKNFAFFHNNEMTFKLGKDFDAKGNGINKIRYLSPFKNKAPMKAWFIVAADQIELWGHFAELALDKMKKELR